MPTPPVSTSAGVGHERLDDVAIVIPTFNEELNIGAVLASMVQQVPDRVAEIIVVDGGSVDRTRAIVAAEVDERIRLIGNTARLQSAGMNLAAEQAAAGVQILIRIDAHARYPDDFVARLLEAHAASGAQSVVTRLTSVGVTPFQRAVAAASNSRFGTGGAAHRSGGGSAFIDHGHHALFDRRTYLALGGYDESFIANEDAEYDSRLRAAGGKIWFTDEAVVHYFPRATPRALARQYFRYGSGRARTRAKHAERLRLRQLIPPVLVVTLSVTLVGGFFSHIIWFVPLGYFAAIGAASAFLVSEGRDLAVWQAALALPIMHLAWGAGFTIQALRAPARKSLGRRRHSRPSTV